MADPTSPKGPKGMGGPEQPEPPVADRTTTTKDHNSHNSTTTAEQTNFELDSSCYEGSEAGTDANSTTKNQPGTEAEGDGDEEMPKPRPQPIKREVDISLILTLPERIEFSKLNDGIMARIEEHLSKPFRFLDHPIAQVNRVKIWDYAPVVAAQMAKQVADTGKPTPTINANSKDGNHKKPSSSSQEQGDDQEAKPRFIPKIDAKSVNPEASSMSVLKEEATQYFNKWRNTFNKRLNDLIVPGQPAAYAGPSRQGQGGPRGGGAAAASAGRNKQQGDKDKGIAYPVDMNMIRRFQPVETTLHSLTVDKRRLLTHAIILMTLSTEHYISYSRLYLLYLASSLHIPAWVLIEEENRVAGGLGKIYKTLCEEAAARELEEKKQAEELQKKAENEKTEEVAQDAHKAQGAQQAQEARPSKEHKKKWRPSINPVQVGKTLLAAGLGMIEAAQGMPTLSLPPTPVAHLMGPLGDCETAVGMFFGVNPNRTRVLTFESLTSVVQDGAIIPLHSADMSKLVDPKAIAPEDRRMRLVFCVSGFLMDKDDITTPWKCLGHHNEVLAISWEVDVLEKVGAALDTLLKSKAWPVSVEAMGGKPAMTMLRQQTWPGALMRVSKIVDNAWVMALTKCSKLQQILSDAMIGHIHGERGVTLIGYGLGARAIYLCLSHLMERRLYGMVDSVVLMGAPIAGDAGTWSALKAVVSGRLVNVYSPTDYMLAFASRQTAYHFGVAGLQQIQGVGGVENHDVSDILGAHVHYTSLVPTILRRIGWDDLKDDLKAPPPQPKLPVAVQQKVPAAPAKGVSPGPNQGQARAGPIEKKENTLPRRGGRNSRGGGRGGRDNNTDKRLADQMGKMSM